MIWNVDASQLVAKLVPVVCIWREASGEGIPGMEAVAWVILNRCKRHDQTAAQVCLAKWQFSSMSAPGDPGMMRWPEITDNSFKAAYDAWTGALSGTVKDPTGAATLYYATSIPAPGWTERSTFTVQIGSQRFYRE